MRAGRLRHRVLVEKNLGESYSDAGTPVEVWATVVERWAAIEPLTGREPVVGDQVKPEVTHTVRLRYTQNVNPGWRVKWIDPKTNLSRVFNIDSVMDRDERHKELTLNVVEQV